MSDPAPLQSPTLRKLQQNLRGRKRAALKPFWNRIARSGTPLIEPLAKDRHHSLLTFVWRARPGTERVALRSWSFGWSGPNTELARLPASDVWYRTFKVPDDFRGTYTFAVNDPLTEVRSWEEWAGRMQTYHLDPLNPRQSVLLPRDPAFPKDPMNNSSAKSSLVELPRAPYHRELVSRKRIPRGTVRRYRLRSRILGDSRRIWVYRPPGFLPRVGNLHVAIVFDGWLYTTAIPTPTILDNLAAEHRIPPVVGVFVDSRRMCTDRLRDMVYHPEPFGRFLAKELLPWIEKAVGIRCHPDRTALIGASGGGLCAVRFSLDYPNMFRLVLSQSGSLWAEDPARHEPGAVLGLILNHPRPAPLRIYMEAGVFDTWSPVNGASLLSANRHVRDVLRMKGYNLTYREFSGGHEFDCWRQSIVGGLTTLMGPHVA